MVSRDEVNSDQIIAEENALVDAMETLASALVDRDVTRAELARRIGITRSEVSQRLGGKRNLTVRSLAAMLNALDFDLIIGKHSRIPLPQPIHVVYRRSGSGPVRVSVPALPNLVL